MTEIYNVLLTGAPGVPGGPVNPGGPVVPWRKYRYQKNATYIVKLHHTLEISYWKFK